MLTDLLFAVAGLIVGRLLCASAYRILNNESLSKLSSFCDHCQHQLTWFDNIPVFSFLCTRGSCRYCKQAISWQYLLAEIATAIAFVCSYNTWSVGWYLLGMLLLECTLITVSITDIKEKLIPHDITYPSMLCGILFSALIRKDFMGTMAGIGASYIFFDFIAHYGLKYYLHVHAEQASDKLPEALDNPSHIPTLAERDIEVMGGGDAVLAAVIAAWLGWQKLVIAIGISLIVGTIIGTTLLVKEMHKNGGLFKYGKPILIGAVVGIIIVNIPFLLFYSLNRVVLAPFSLLFASLVGAIIGMLVAIIFAESKTAKQSFPFGPALAIGGFVAMFWI